MLIGDWIRRSKRIVENSRSPRRAKVSVRQSLEQLEKRILLATLQLSPIADNTLYEDPTGNLSNGAGIHLFVGETLQAQNRIRRGLVKFDVSSVPSGATINTVTLALNMSKAPNFTAQNIGVHRASKSWGEGTSNASLGGTGSSDGDGIQATTNDATWLYTFFGPRTAWTSAGGDFVGTASATTAVSGLAKYQWSGSGLIADVQQWLASPSTNNGWLLKGNETTTGTVKQFDSRENSIVANRPLLTIDYTVAATAPDLTVTKSHSGNFRQGDTGDTYTITVSNSGAGPTTGTVSVVDTLPSGLTATAFSGTGWNVNLGTLTATRNDALSAGGSYPALTLTVNVSSTAAVSVTNTATVSGGGETVTNNNTASDVTTVTPVNNTPTANAQTVTTLEDSDVVVTLTGDDGDPETNQGLSFTITTLPISGTLYQTPDGATRGSAIASTGTVVTNSARKLIYAPAGNANGSPVTTFAFTTTDDAAAGAPANLTSTPATVTINVTPLNDPPTGTDKQVTTSEDTDYVFTAADFGFTDSLDNPANSLQAVKIATLPLASLGTLKLSNGDVTAGQFVSKANLDAGNLKFVPVANTSGSTTFTFQVQDDGTAGSPHENLDQSPNTITIGVTAVNDPPTAAAQNLSTTEDTEIVVTLSGDDGDADVAQVLAFTISTLPTNGSLFQTPDGIARGVAITQTGTVVTNNQGKVLFAPTDNATGSPYAAFAFTATDDAAAGSPSNLTSSPSTVTINVTSVNDPPSGTDKVVTALEDTDFVFWESDFGFTDPLDQPSDALLAVKIATLPLVGTLTNNGGIVAAGQSISVADLNAGRLKFRAASNASGSSYASFTFQVQDDGETAANGNDLDPSPNTISVNVTPVNDPPSGAENTVITLVNTDYLFTADDFGFTDAVDNPPHALFAVKLTTMPGTGTLSNDGAAVSAGQFIPVADINAGLLKFTPMSDTSGAPYTSFTFQVQDDGGILDNGADLDATPRAMTVNVTLPGVNNPPIANSQSLNGTEDNDVTITLTGNDGDPGVSQSLTFAIAANPTHGTLVNFNPATGAVTYHPNTDYNGSDSFTFTVTDDESAGGSALTSSAATITVNLTPLNDQPIATAQSVFAAEDADTGLVLAGIDSDPEVVQSLTFMIVASPTHGTLSGFNATTGGVTYHPNPNYVGPDSFTFRVTDDAAAGPTSNLSSAAGTVTINVTAVNDPPSFTKGADQVVLRNAGAKSVANWATNISRGGGVDEANQGLTFEIVSSSLTSLFSAEPAISASGVLSYTPAVNTVGTATIGLRLRDDAGGNDASATVTFTISVNNPVPSIVELNPSSVAEPANNSNTTTVTITGSNFITGVTQVLVNGQPHAATVNASTISVGFLNSELQTNSDFAVHLVSVSNPAPGGGTSSSVPLTVINSTISQFVNDVDSAAAPPATTVTVATPPLAPPGQPVTQQVSATAELQNNSAAGSSATVIIVSYAPGSLSGLVIAGGGSSNAVTEAGTIDVKASGVDASDVINLNITYAANITGAQEAALELFYYNPITHALERVLSSGGATPVKNTTDILNGSGQAIAGGSFAVRFDNTSTPKITELTGTVLTVAEGNQAPVLNNAGSPYVIAGVGSRLPTELADGTSVAEILAKGAGGDPISDADANDPAGIALIGVDTSLGNWQFRFAGDPMWMDVQGGGTLSNTNALLLPADARLRFVTSLIPHHATAAPFLPLESKLTAGLTFRAWDQSVGVAGQLVDISTNGGATPFSTATETVATYFETRLYRSFNSVAELNYYTLEAEFNAITGNTLIQDRSTSGFTGFTILMSPIPGVATAPLYRLYYGTQFNANGTETDMGYRYLTTNLAEAEFLEGLGPVDKRAQRDGTYFREQGVNNGSAILGYIHQTQVPGTIAMNQVYRLDEVDKPTRLGTTQVAPVKQQNGDHVFSTNPPVDMAKKGTWRLEAFRGYVRELSPNAAATAAPAMAQAVADESTLPIQITTSDTSATQTDDGTSWVSTLVASAGDSITDSWSETNHSANVNDASATEKPLVAAKDNKDEIALAIDLLFTHWHELTDMLS